MGMVGENPPCRISCSTDETAEDQLVWSNAPIRFVDSNASSCGGESAQKDELARSSRNRLESVAESVVGERFKHWWFGPIENPACKRLVDG